MMFPLSLNLSSLFLFPLSSFLLPSLSSSFRYLFYALLFPLLNYLIPPFLLSTTSFPSSFHLSPFSRLFITPSQLTSASLQPSLLSLPSHLTPYPLSPLRSLSFLSSIRSLLILLSLHTSTLSPFLSLKARSPYSLLYCVASFPSSPGSPFASQL